MPTVLSLLLGRHACDGEIFVSLIYIVDPLPNGLYFWDCSFSRHRYYFLFVWQLEHDYQMHKINGFTIQKQLLSFAPLCFRFSPEKIWYIDQMLKVLSEVQIMIIYSFSIVLLFFL